MSFESMNYDTFFKMAAVGGEPIHATVSRVVANAMFHECDTSLFETAAFYEFYGKAMLAEQPGVDTQALFEFCGKAMFNEYRASEVPRKENKDI